MLRRNPDFALRDIAGAPVLMPVAGDALKVSALYAANPIGVDILQFLETPRTRAELLAYLCREYEVEEAQAAGDLAEYLDDLLEKRIVLETP